jgi:hypothetical protein
MSCGYNLNDLGPKLGLKLTSLLGLTTLNLEPKQLG